MSDTIAQTERQSEHPNLLKGNPAWVKGGPSPNKTGKSKYLTRLERMIRKQEKPELVLQVVAAMREDACAHEKSSPAAAKVYFAAVGLPMNREPPKIDLTKAPDEVVNWLADNVQ